MNVGNNIKVSEHYQTVIIEAAGVSLIILRLCVYASVFLLSGISKAADKSCKFALTCLARSAHTSIPAFLVAQSTAFMVQVT